MSKYNVQQTVHLLPLQFDVADYINSFLFVTIESKIKGIKKEIVKKFENAIQSRKNNLDFEPDTIEHWSICLSSIEDDDDHEEQFQGISCGICGNYKQVNMEICEQIKCKCNTV
jgi:hypothetical protein